MVGAYWGPRQEKIEKCVDRLSMFLTELKKCDPSLAIWHERGRSRKEALAKNVEIEDVNDLIRLLEKGRSKRDVGASVIQELGFRVGLWNNFSETCDIGLNITCGLYWDSPNQTASLSNYVILELPEDLGAFEQAQYTSCVLTAVAKAWEPAWAGVMSRQAMSARGFNAKHPFVDWMVYVPWTVDKVQPPSSSIKLDGLGSIVLVQPIPPSGEESEEIQRTRRIVEMLLKPAA
jgi:hypothetical protein